MGNSGPVVPAERSSMRNSGSQVPSRRSSDGTRDEDVLTAKPSCSAGSIKQAARNEGFMIGNAADEKRTLVPLKKIREGICWEHAHHQDVHGAIGQLQMKFPFDTCIGSGCLIEHIDIMGRGWDLRLPFLLTCAHNFAVKDDLTGEFVFPEPGHIQFYQGRDGVSDYFKKYDVKDFVIHPKYFDNPSPASGFDIAIARLDLEPHILPQDSNRTIKKKLGIGSPYYVNLLVNSAEDKWYEWITVAGYPAEDEKRSHQYTMTGCLSESYRNTAGGHVLLYKDIDTTGGQSGSPVFSASREERRTDLVGVHTGYAGAGQGNVATAWSPLLEEWLIEVLKNMGMWEE